uniref:PLAT domain-containing protein n=1 Tax=Macrostomum lignano TaxID=282301 RepID=A0A1I8JRU1_9PLAT
GGHGGGSGGLGCPPVPLRSAPPIPCSRRERRQLVRRSGKILGYLASPHRDKNGGGASAGADRAEDARPLNEMIEERVQREVRRGRRSRRHRRARAALTGMIRLCLPGVARAAARSRASKREAKRSPRSEPQVVYPLRTYSVTSCQGTQTSSEYDQSAGPAPGPRCHAYILYVTTGDRIGAGTNAAVSAVLYGELGSSGLRPIPLANSLTHKRPFRRGRTDKFVLENLPDLGGLRRLRVGHASDALNHWYLHTRRRSSALAATDDNNERRRRRRRQRGQASSEATPTAATKSSASSGRRPPASMSHRPRWRRRPRTAVKHSRWRGGVGGGGFVGSDGDSDNSGDSDTLEESSASSTGRISPDASHLLLDVGGCWLQRHAKYTMSDEMVRAVARSLDLYLRVRRLEEGFDLSSVGAVGVTGGGGGGYGSVISSRRLHDKPVKMQFRNPLTRCQVESMSGALSGQPANDSTEKSKTSSSSRSRSAVRLRHRLDIVEATTALTTPRRTRGRVHHRQRQRMSTRGGDDSDDENQRNRLIDNASAILDLLAPPPGRALSIALSIAAVELIATLKQEKKIQSKKKMTKKDKNPEHQSALSLVADEAERLAKGHRVAEAQLNISLMVRSVQRRHQLLREQADQQRRPGLPPREDSGGLAGLADEEETENDEAATQRMEKAGASIDQLRRGIRALMRQQQQLREAAAAAMATGLSCSVSFGGGAMASSRSSDGSGSGRELACFQHYLDTFYFNCPPQQQPKLLGVGFGRRWRQASLAADAAAAGVGVQARLPSKLSRLLQARGAYSGFSPFLFTNQSSNSEQQQQQQLPQPTPPSELDRPSKRRSGAVAAQSRTGGASRSVELPDAVVSGVGVAFVVGAVPGLSLSTPPGAQLHQRHQGSGGSDERQGRIRTQAVQQQQQQRLPQFASSTIDSEAAESRALPAISQSQMIGSPAANQVGAAAQQPEP